MGNRTCVKDLVYFSNFIEAVPALYINIAPCNNISHPSCLMHALVALSMKNKITAE